MVREITYFPSGVMVKTEDNKVYRADYVMVSVSLGVLQTDLIRFKPQLPVGSCSLKLKDICSAFLVYFLSDIVPFSYFSRSLIFF